MASREREIGGRAALGATDTQIRRLVRREGLALYRLPPEPASGALLAVGGTRMLAAFLYGVQPGDPLTFGPVCLVVLAIGALAVYVPVRTLTRIDPLIALRSQ